MSSTVSKHWPLGLVTAVPTVRFGGSVLEREDHVRRAIAGDLEVGGSEHEHFGATAVGACF